MDNKNWVGGIAEMSFTPPPFKMVIQTPTGLPLGELFETTAGTLAFTGNVEQSAVAFFNAVVEHHSKVMTDAKARIERITSTARESLAAVPRAIPTQSKPNDMPMSEYIDMLLTEPAQHIEPNDAASLKACRAHWEAHKGRLGVFADFWEGWRACTESGRAKA